MAAGEIRIRDPRTGKTYIGSGPVPPGYELIGPATAPKPSTAAPVPGTARGATTAPPPAPISQFPTFGTPGDMPSTSLAITPENLRSVGAAALRFGPGLIPAPGLSGVAGAAGEAGAQLVESGEISSPLDIGVAAVAPPGAAALFRGGRAIGRTATRMVPPLFQRAQAKAFKSVDDIVAGLRVNADELFAAARSAQQDRVATPALRRKIEELGFSVADEPTNPGLQQVRGAIKNSLVLLGGGEDLTLRAINQLRTDMGRTIATGRAAPELSALYGALRQDLEAAAAKGGEGAKFLTGALKAFKQDLGALRLQELAAKAPIRTSTPVGGDALNIAKLKQAIAKDRKEFTALLGEDGIKIVDRFLERFRSLPPTQALTAWNTMLLIGSAGVGGITGGGPGAAIMLLVPEFGRNMWGVGKNPELVNRLLNLLVNSARAVAPQAMPSRLLEPPR